MLPFPNGETAQAGRSVGKFRQTRWYPPNAAPSLFLGVAHRSPRAFAEQLNCDSIGPGRCRAVRGLLERTKLSAEEVDYLVWGTVVFNVATPNIAREIVLDARLPNAIPAHTESMQCASGLKALLSAVDMVQWGNAEVVIAGGSDSLSSAQVPLDRNVAQSLALYSSNKLSLTRMLKSAGAPWSWMPKRPSVAERFTGKSMGYHADIMAEACKISREAQDQFAVESHSKASRAAAAGVFDDEIVPVYVKGSRLRKGAIVVRDMMVRDVIDPKKIASLKPAFRTNGTITAATASPLTDGGAACLIMSAAKAKELGYPTDVGVRSWASSAISPFPNLLLAPALAIPLALARARLSLADIDFFEIHEAFAGQVLATIEVLKSAELCRKYLGLHDAVGEIPLQKVNIFGGSLCIGHPFGATGARLATNAARILRMKKETKYVLVSICGAGGIGLVTIFEKLPSI